jgi:hypothetical protein
MQICLHAILLSIPATWWMEGGETLIESPMGADVISVVVNHARPDHDEI